MTDMQAAIGLHQLQKLPKFHAGRKSIAERYNRALGEFAELETPTEQDWAEHAWHLYVLRLNLNRLTISRDDFINELQQRKIGSSVHFIPVYLFTYYRERYRYSARDFPVASGEFERILSLPCSPKMTDDDVQDVIEEVTAIVEQNAVSRNTLAVSKKRSAMTE